MQIVEGTLWACGSVAALVAIPWLTLGISVIYFNVLRRDRDLAWFDVPVLCAMLAAAAVINLATAIACFAVYRVTGNQPLPSPPQWTGGWRRPSPADPHNQPMQRTGDG